MKRVRVRIATIFFGVLVALTGAVQPAGAADLNNAWLQNLHTGKCLLARGGADHEPAVQFQCLPYADQKWTLVEKGNGQFQIRNVNSGKCLLVFGTGNEAAAIQFTCLDYADQYWRFNDYPGRPDWFWVQNVNSGKCLLARGGDNTQLVQYDCLEYVDQAWGLYI